LLKENKVTPELEKDLGMSKEQLDQFVKKFEKAPKTAAGGGREIDVKPGTPQEIDPNRKLPELTTGATASTKQMRERGSFVQDTLRGNNEGVRFEPPPEYRAGFDAFKSSLLRSRAIEGGRPATPQK
jgi:hypothetical protein